MDTAQKRLVRTETTIATVLCAVLPTLLVSFLFEPFPVALRGTDGLVGFAFKSTLVAVCLMSTLMTLGTRAKVRQGTVAPLVRTGVGWLQLLPRTLPLRAVMLALSAALLLSAVTAAIGNLLALEPLYRSGFIAFNLIIGALIGLFMTPLIQTAALADSIPRAH